jgi:hypothetical protein
VIAETQKHLRRFGQHTAAFGNPPLQPRATRILDQPTVFDIFKHQTRRRRMHRPRRAALILKLHMTSLVPAADPYILKNVAQPFGHIVNLANHTPSRRIAGSHSTTFRCFFGEVPMQSIWCGMGR